MMMWGLGLALMAGSARELRKPSQTLVTGRRDHNFRDDGTAFIGHPFASPRQMHHITQVVDYTNYRHKGRY